jgi:hypothetical protein
MRGRLWERIIEGPGVFPLFVDKDHERAREPGQFAGAGIGYNDHAQLPLGGGVTFHHGGAVREGEAALSAVQLAGHALDCNVGHGPGARTLKEDTTKPPAESLRAQQSRFDNFRYVFNNERPHEGLNSRVPASIYISQLR